MKKVVILLLSLCLLLITGCEKEPEKFYLDSEYYDSFELIDVPGTTISELEEKNGNFAVFVYMASCTSCANFDKVLESFLEKNNMTFYAVSLLNIKGTKMEDTIRYSPSVVIYKDGEIVSYLNAISDDDMEYYKSSEGFKEWFTKYVYLKESE